MKAKNFLIAATIGLGGFTLRTASIVSTDAIAMGLNLPIETVCFSTLQKWNGQEDVQLAPWEILQASLLARLTAPGGRSKVSACQWKARNSDGKANERNT